MFKLQVILINTNFSNCLWASPLYKLKIISIIYYTYKISILMIDACFKFLWYCILLPLTLSPNAEVGWARPDKRGGQTSPVPIHPLWERRILRLLTGRSSKVRKGHRHGNQWAIQRLFCGQNMAVISVHSGNWANRCIKGYWVINLAICKNCGWLLGPYFCQK